VNTSSVNLPAGPALPPAYIDPVPPLWIYLGPNDSPLHRGSGEETGDNEAQPDGLGAGYAEPTVDPTSFGGTSSIRHPSRQHFDIEQEGRDNDGFEVMLPTDGRLGLTNIGDKPADDWAADTGETRTPEGSEP
jgi:hypothetical protein